MFPVEKFPINPQISFFEFALEAPQYFGSRNTGNNEFLKGFFLKNLSFLLLNNLRNKINSGFSVGSFITGYLGRPLKITNKPMAILYRLCFEQKKITPIKIPKQSYFGKSQHYHLLC